MSLLYRVIYASHAKGTHHKLALDALDRLTLADAKSWQRLFLKHVELYLEGSKAPDDTFKDFKNHVLHVRDGYWGGAPEKATSWYQNLVRSLRERNWQEAVWCAGVLSHYYTDPIHPFHTAQSSAENNIHRAVEWSISRDYDRLKREAQALLPSMLVEAPGGTDWLKEFMCQGAELSNAGYETLIAHYDFNTGVVDPPSGLDPIARELIGRLLLYAADGYARVLERAIADAAVTPPEVTLSLETVVATLKVPLKLVQKKLADAEDRRVVEAMYDELMETGRVEAELPEDDRQVRDLHAKEVLAERAAHQAVVRANRIPAKAGARQQRMSAVAALPPPAAAGDVVRQLPVAESTHSNSIRADRFAQAVLVPAATTKRANTRDPLSEARVIALASTPVPRTYLALGDDIEAAPSIGPKTAARFHAIGIRTVSDFINADAFETAERLDARHISAEMIADWQDQAHLVMAIPGLRGGHAQLLVGAGYHTVASIGSADPSSLVADVLKFASTPDGQRVLRDGEPPDIEKVKSWVDEAHRALAA